MIKIMFVCHGNICRSPMAEFVLKDMIKRKGLEAHFYIASSATSTEEIGNPVHRGTRKKLAEYDIFPEERCAVQFRKADYAHYDYIIAMDSFNIKNILKIIGQDIDQKVFRLMDFSNKSRDIADPWYTGNFDDTYNDVKEGCEELLKHILKEKADLIE